MIILRVSVIIVIYNLEFEFEKRNTAHIEPGILQNNSWICLDITFV